MPLADQRLLLPVTYGFSVRYLIPTGVLEGLAEVCRPVVALGWDDAELEQRLGRCGVEVVRLPEASLTHRYRMYRRRLDAIHRRRLDSPTTAIRRRRQLAMVDSTRDRAVSRVRGWGDVLSTSSARARRAVEADEAAQVHEGTNVAHFAELLERTRADAVFSLTPYHDQDGLLLWAARARGVPSVTSVISFDNPTTRERLLCRSDLVLVWNRHNEAEMLRSYPDLTAERVEVIGAPQFDLHRRPELVQDRGQWAASRQLDPGRPVILYGAGPADLVPGEPGLVRLLDDAITAGRLPGTPQILVRPHPADPVGPWEALGENLRHGRVVAPWTAGSSGVRSWPSASDVVDQMSTLAHCAVHVNVCSSMTLDGAMFDRPQIGPTFAPGASAAELRRIADLYRQEHWRPIAASGGLVTAGDPASLDAAVAAALERPDRGGPGRRHMLRDLLTHDDGRSSERLVDAVRRWLATCV